jgi:hypothetical protein
MKVTYENDYIVFDINKGPKQITEVLNAKGQEGWMASSVVNVAGTNLVFFLVRPTYELPDTKSDEAKQLNKLWGTKSGE